MKSNVTEATITNMELLYKLSDIIMSKLVDLKLNQQQIIKGYTLTDDLQPLYRTYKNTKYKGAIVKAAATDYIFTFGKLKKNSYGYYSLEDAEIKIHLYNVLKAETNFVDMIKVVTKKQLMNSKLLRSTLIHELRHLLQHSEYPEYMKKDLGDDNFVYAKSKVEIDAAFSHILNEVDINRWDTPGKYATAVMVTLVGYKRLTPKERSHYYKKAINYYYQVVKNIEKEDINQAIKIVYDNKEYNNPKDFVKLVLKYIYGSYFERGMITNKLALTDYNYIVDLSLKYYRTKKTKK